jgi:hypothetical protein
MASLMSRDHNFVVQIHRYNFGLLTYQFEQAFEPNLIVLTEIIGV